MMTSSLSKRAFVASNLNLSISSFIEEVFLYVGIARRDVGFRLIVIVITDKEVHLVFREQGLEFRVELGRQSLVVGDYKGGTLYYPFDDVCHGEGLSRSRNAEKYLMGQASMDALDEFRYGSGLIPHRFIIAYQLEFLHFIM